MEGAADRNGLIQLKIPVHMVVAAHAGAFRGAVEVGEFGVGQSFPPNLELLDGEYLGAEGNGVQILRLHLFKSLEAGDHRQSGYHPADCVDLVLVHVLHQLNGEHKKMVGNDIGGGTEFDGGVELLQAGIKIQRCLIGKYGVFVEAQSFGQIFDIVDDTAVASHYALGNTGGARGEHNVDGVGIQLNIPNMSQGSFINGGGGHIVIDHGLAMKIKGLSDLSGGAVAEHDPGVQILEDQLDTEAGHFLVDGHIVAATVHAAVEAADALGVLAHEHHHGFAVVAFGSKIAADGPAVMVNLGKSQAFFTIGERQLVRYTGDSLFQVFQYIGLMHL